MQSLSSTTTQSWMVWFLKGLLLLGVVVLLGRMVELQIIKGNYFHALAEDNRIRRIPILAPRGLILARGGQILVDNKEIEKWIRFSPTSGYEKVAVEENAPQEERIKEYVRAYPLGENVAHLTGYLGQVSEEEFGKVDPNCIEKGPLTIESWLGRSGLEEQYGCKLRGIDGEELVEVDTMGKKVRTIGTKPPVPGENLVTTIDYELQKKTAEVLSKSLTEDEEPAKAAAVVSDGQGEILSFYSHPSFDPNVFLQQTPEDSQKVGEYLNDPDIPLFNRVIGGAYHPGSVFKIVTSAAALEEGKITKDWTFEDQGVIRVNEFEYANWYFTQYGGREGHVDVRRALARSTDTFYYKVGEFLGAQSLADWANKFGMGEKTGIDLPGEVAGLVPTPEWKKRVKNENWFLGNTYHMSIGQGDLATSVLEVNAMTSVIASDGFLCKPHLAGNIISDCKKLPISQSTIDTIKEGLVAACTTGGTAFPFFDFPVSVACKTGTAETEEEDKTHAWFTVMAPAQDPEVVITILVEKAGEGSSVAAPLAREILDFWYLRKNP